MGILVNQGQDIDIHHNIVEDTAISPYDTEDKNYNPYGSEARKIVNLRLRNNKFSRWGWHLPGTTVQVDWWAYGVQWSQNASKIDLHDNIIVADNELHEGPMGFGRPSAEIEKWGECRSCRSRVDGIAMMFGFSGAAPGTTLTITGNVSYIDAEIVDKGDYYGVAGTWDTVICTDNDFQGLDWWFVDCPNVTFERNGTSSHELR